jgi:hypothetical protein
MREQIQRFCKGFAIEVNSDLACSIFTANHVLLASKGIVIEADSAFLSVRCSHVDVSTWRESTN